MVPSVTRTVLGKCGTKDCHFTPEEHEEWMEQCRAAGGHQHRADQPSHQHHPKKGMGGNNSKSKVVAVICWPLHDLIDNGSCGNDVKEINGERVYFAWDLHGEILIERVLDEQAAVRGNYEYARANSGRSASQRSAVSIGAELSGRRGDEGDDGRRSRSNAGGNPEVIEVPQAGDGAKEGPPFLLPSPASGASSLGIAPPDAGWGSGGVGASLGPPAMTSPSVHSEWCQRGMGLLLSAARVRGININLAFELGDWMNEGDGHEASQYWVPFERYFSRHQLLNFASVADRVPKSVRLVARQADTLTFDHFRAVARLEPPEQRETLERAAAQCIPARALWEREANPTGETCVCPECGKEHRKA